MERTFTLLDMLHKASPRERGVIVSNASPDFINALCEISLNVLQGHIPLSNIQYKLLKKKKKVIRLIADKKVKHLKKKKTINQTGGFLLPLLGAAIPFIASLINRS